MKLKRTRFRFWWDAAQSGNKNTEIWLFPVEMTNKLRQNICAHDLICKFLQTVFPLALYCYANNKLALASKEL